MAEDLKEYIISVESKNQLDALYEKMESEHGTEFIPDRKVELVHRRPMSRNTHYMLTKSEAQNLMSEEGIINVEIAPREIGARPAPHWIQRSSDWDRCGDQNSNDINWGLLRSSLDQNILNWGASFCTPGDKQIISSSDGLNVDVVISDGMVNPTHPEMALNENGTGGTRAVQYNWLQHRLQVQGIANGTYVYTPYIDNANPSRTSDNNHGMHVAGTVAGNRQGWAKRANIYNLNPYGTDINAIGELFHFDYIRAFHASKVVNPVTKVKNPTVVNCSWGYTIDIPITGINRIIFRGTTINGPFTAQNLNTLFTDYNIYSDNISDIILAFRYNALDIDVQDAINDGIIIVGSAGNNTTRMDVDGGAAWNDAVVTTTDQTYNYHRGSTPSVASTAICVGAIDNYSDSVEMKAYYSNYGARINIWAPGSAIISSVHTEGFVDPRNSNFLLAKYSGTSMASPQVCGIIACLMQKYPKLRQVDVLKFLNEKLSIKNGVTDDPFDAYKTLEGSVTGYLYNYPHRRSTNRTVPDYNYMLREGSSVKYPRLKIHRK